MKMKTGFRLDPSKILHILYQWYSGTIEGKAEQCQPDLKRIEKAIRN